MKVLNKEENPKITKIKGINPRTNTIIVIDETNNIKKTFKTVFEAAEFIGTTMYSIVQCCQSNCNKGKNKIKNYIVKYG